MNENVTNNELIEETKMKIFEGVTKKGLAFGAALATIVLAGGYVLKDKFKTKFQKIYKKADKIVKEAKESEKKKEKD